MTNPLIINILGYLKKQNCACSIIDLVNLCQQDFLLLIKKDVDPQIAIFQKNFFVMNALYQIQRDIKSEGFLLTIFPLEICLVPNHAAAKGTLAMRDTDLAHYYLSWSNLNNITLAEVESLFSRFWQRYRAVDKVAAALTTLEVDKNIDWFGIRRAYQKKIAITHPDKGGCAADFIEIRQAYEVLSWRYHRKD